MSFENKVNPRIELLQEKKLIGVKLKMSFMNFNVALLWQKLMPRRSEIINAVSQDYISLAMYDKNHFTDFNPANEFEKWAFIEVSDLDDIPKGLEAFTLSSGLYAVFKHVGLSTDHSIYQYIYGTWIQNSEYDLDDRPHFEILGPKYMNNDPTSEEEIWIPIILKQ